MLALRLIASERANASESMTSLAWLLTLCRIAKLLIAGMAKEPTIPNMATATMSSTRVKPLDRGMTALNWNLSQLSSLLRLLNSNLAGRLAGLVVSVVAQISQLCRLRSVRIRPWRLMINFSVSSLFWLHRVKVPLLTKVMPLGLKCSELVGFIPCQRTRTFG